MSAPPLIGRSRARLELERRLVSTTLVTLLGPPGVGKSRLAATLDGVHVALADVRDTPGFWDAIASALSVEGSDDPKSASLGALLGAERLILDDADAVAPDAIDELTRHTSLPILVTRRERLGLDVEHLFELEPLDEDEAVALFATWLERRRGHGPTDPELPWIRELVGLLDGLPLALELAATRSRVLAPRALVHRLRESLAVLPRGDGPRGDGPRGDGLRGDGLRHASLDAAYEWTWRSLGPDEQLVLAQLTVFEGGFDVEAAEAVARVGPTTSILDVLERLRDRSLLRAHGAELRLVLLRTLAHFVRARSDARVLEEAASRHADYYADLVARASVERRAIELPNVLAMVDRMQARRVPESHDAERGLRALLALAPTLLVRGPLGAFADRLAPALAASARSGAELGLRIRAAAMRARVLTRMGDLEGASEDLSHARLLAAKAGDSSGEVARAGVELALARGDDPHQWLVALDDRPEHALLLARAAARRGDRDEALAACARAQRGDRLTRLSARVLAATLADSPTVEGELAELIAEAETLGDLAAQARLHLLRDGDDALPTATRLATLHGDATLRTELEVRANAAAPIPLRVAADGSGFERGGARVELGTRRALRGMLARLVAAHATREVLAWDALLEAGWPGERVRAEAGMQRVRVAISTLRKLGLAEDLRTLDGGYALDPAGPIEVLRTR
ncbi:MAG: hypothetical protein KF901_24520 [Myxococcales bacterium]|nr:hypothetical protein [Myxococcales bacterium]